MPFRRFILIDAFCATAVVALFFGLSYLYGERLTTWIQRSELGVTALVVLTVAVVGGYFLWKRRRARLLTGTDGALRQDEACSVGANHSKDVPS
jgi:membrane protein DedA with SNARE-associated domain